MGCAYSGSQPMGTTPSGKAVETIASADFHTDYVLLDKLGSGSFGSVYSAAKAGGLTSGKLAVKIVDVRKLNTKSGEQCGDENEEVDLQRYEAFRSEVQHLRMVAGHANMCHILGSCVQNGLAYIVLERCDRTLWHALDRLPVLNETVLRGYFRSMLRALAFVHLRGIIHRDVKPDNFMCSGPENIVKLCDFGLARSLPQDSDLHAGICGTPAFMPPEMLNGLPYGAKADVWSFGVVAYVLCIGSLPYMGAGAGSSALKKAIAEGKPLPTFAPEKTLRHGGLSLGMSTWLRELLCRDASSRPTCFEALDADMFEEPAPSEVDLRPALHAAKKSGAFADSNKKRSGDNAVDLRVKQLQERHSSRKPWSDKVSLGEASTVVSSEQSWKD